MRIVSWMSGLSLSMVTATGLLLSGCGQSGTEPAQTESQATQAADVQTVAAVDHGGWWCTEHGIPEGICARCNSKVATEYQQKGDWCEEHSRPDSQCFICHPELEEKFAAQFEAKFGEKPPEAEVE